VIDRGLSALGETPKQAIWFCLENKFHFDRTKLPGNIEEFQDALEKTFGLGYSFLEALFREYLHEATGENFGPFVSFADCVNQLYLKTTTPIMTPISSEPLVESSQG